MENHMLRPETIRNALTNSDKAFDWFSRSVAMEACIGREDVPLETILIGIHDMNSNVCRAAARACKGRDIPLETIQDWLNDRNQFLRLAAMNACAGRKDVPLEIILAGLRDLELEVSQAAARACTGRYMSLEVVQDWVQNRDWRVRLVAVEACQGREDVPLETILIGLNDTSMRVRRSAAKACRGRNMPIETIDSWLKNSEWHVRFAAMKACIGRKDVPLEMILVGLRDISTDVRDAAVEACRGHDIPVEVLQDLLKDQDWRLRLAAIKSYQGHDMPLETLLIGVYDPNVFVWRAALEACRGYNIPLKEIQNWLEHPGWRLHLAAITACMGREDVPAEVIQVCLRDHDDEVRKAAIKVCLERNITIPVSRDFEPNGYVYKRCLNGVIVVATIPLDAHVRGKPDAKCRASKVKIEQIIGDFFGEKVGISTYDHSTFYHEGDIVEVEDFDLGSEECAPGFHFFNTQEEAEHYRR